MPADPSEGGENPNLIIITSRPYNPVYKSDDKLDTPDRIIVVDTPDAGGYITGINSASVVLPGQKLTYNCWMAPRTDDINCWKIECIVELPVSTDGFGQHITNRLYPFGCSGYNFNPNDVRSYIWGLRY